MMRRTAPAQLAIIHASDQTRVTRLAVAGRTVVRKQPLGPGADGRLRHEGAMLERLRGVPGVAQLVDEPEYPDSLVLADAGSASLAEPARPFPVEELIELAVQLSLAVAGMHGRAVMHRDIAPANIVLSSAGAPCLVDFALASSFAEPQRAFAQHRGIVGTLPYLAPEQTGRSRRPVDQRADLYALGATLYELAIGEPPFGSGDPFQLTHDHLARVPAAPVDVSPVIPRALSEIIMHLLEKEPHARYQSAESLLHDLERLRAAKGRSRPDPVRIGEHDVPPRLLPPSRLVGREEEVAALEEAFDRALSDRCRAVLVSGSAGVGKTALVNELRPVVAAHGGRFVAGKFDESRRDLEFDAVFQAFSALTRLLLAEPEEELGELRERILRALGPNAGLATAVSPESAALLRVPPDPGDPLTARVRAQRAGADFVRAVASRERPLVVFVDDLQWAWHGPLGLFDIVLSEDPIQGLLLVGAYRDAGLDRAHPLTELLARFRDLETMAHLRLGDLPAPSHGALVAQTLRVDPAAAASLAQAIEPATSGNPYETVEVLNALRRDGLLIPARAGWRWDGAAIRDRLRETDVAALSGARIEALPHASQKVLEAMACLGGRAELRVLQTATGEAANVAAPPLAPALEDGLLVLDPGAHEAVRFHHDRLREIVLSRLAPQRRRALQLAMARRLAVVPELYAAAAEQYLPVVDALDDPAERRQVVALLRRAASQAAMVGDDRLVDALLAAALRLIDGADVATLIEMHTARHAALHGLAMVEQADEEYRIIERLVATPLQRAAATTVQVNSLTRRNRVSDALRLGCESLREHGIAVPARDRVAAELDHQFEYLYQWLDRTDDLERPEISDPALLAAARLIDAVEGAAVVGGDPTTNAWLGLEAIRIWLHHGPARRLLAPAPAAAWAAVVLRNDFTAAYRTHRRLLTFGEARGYEPETSEARGAFAVQCGWFEPIENGLEAVRRARKGLIAGGDPARGGRNTYVVTVPGLMECAPSLDVLLAEVEAGLVFVRRIGAQDFGWMAFYRWLVEVLRGDRSAAASVPVDASAENPWARMHGHIVRALTAALFDDPDGLNRHTASVMRSLVAFGGLYPNATPYLLRGLALAEQARTTDGDALAAGLSELDELRRWLAERAADAPENFLHVVLLLDAERAWAVGELRAAELAFDAARREVAQRQRPWHRALITERAARFRLAHGLHYEGQELLAAARREYLAWGATAKAAQLDWAHPALQPAHHAPGDEQLAVPDHRSTVTPGTIDLLGILSASQALSSETSIGPLHARVGEALGNMMGASGVHLVLWSDERQCWLAPAPDGDDGLVAVGEDGELPLSVLRYLQRTREPLLVTDATRDDRFASDPYYGSLDVCSLLGVPILARGTLAAALLLENRLVRGAFTGGRLDAVKLIAGQLAVSVDNAQLYAEHRRIADEQAALRRVATLVAEGASPTTVFDAVAAELERLLEADGVVLARHEPGGDVTVVAHRGVGAQRLPPGTRVRHQQRAGEDASDDIARLARALGMRASTGAPIETDGRPWGVALTQWRDEGPPTDGEERMTQFSRLLETAIANAHSRDQLSASRARLVTEADAARRRVVRDLHDGAQQRLVHTAITLGLAERALERGEADASALISEAKTHLQQANEDLRELAHGILPADLTRGGLRGAVDAVVERLDLDVKVTLPPDRLPAEIEASAYFIVAEALTNIVKHARADSAEVRASIHDGTLRVEIRDDGIGGANPSGHGLVGMGDRVTALGGRLGVESPVGGGTVLTATLPTSHARGDRLPG